MDFTKYKKWITALATIFVFTVAGIVIYELTASIIPAILLFAFALLFSIDKWFIYYTRKHKKIGMLYRLLLNLTILSLLGLLIYLTVNIFTGDINAQPIFASLTILGTLAMFIWVWKIVNKNSWRWPSMKLTIASLIIIFLVFSFAGVEPLHTYKNDAISYAKLTIQEINEYFKTDNQEANANPVKTTSFIPPQSTTSAETTSISPTITLAPQISTGTAGINFKSGTYKEHYIGLVKAPDGVMAGNNCYGKFIVLVNNKKATNPTYSELLNFLKADDTDAFPYRYTIHALLPYYGTAESHIDLARLQSIIDGTEQPLDPRVCADFAERLHNNAEKAGIRCAYVSVSLVGYNDPYSYGLPSATGHALVACETLDRGMVYIDCTGIPASTDGPSRCVKIVNVAVDKPYTPVSLFPDPGWSSTWSSMGIVTDIFITWDGAWG